jgi:IS5 family transposase
MQSQRGFLEFEDRLKELSAEGDALETLPATVYFEMLRSVLMKALRRGVPSKNGRVTFDPVLKFKMLALQSLHGLSLAQTSYMCAPSCPGCGSAALAPDDRVSVVETF